MKRVQVLRKIGRNYTCCKAQENAMENTTQNKSKIFDVVNHELRVRKKLFGRAYNNNVPDVYFPQNKSPFYATREVLRFWTSTTCFPLRFRHFSKYSTPEVRGIFRDNLASSTSSISLQKPFFIRRSTFFQNTNRGNCLTSFATTQLT